MITNELVEKLSKAVTAQDVFAFEQLSLEHEQVSIPVKNYFVPGVYIREIFIPKGIIITGKIHKYKQFHVILKGVLEVLIEGKIETVVGPCVIVSPAGAKRIARAIEDVTWLMVHGTEETDLEKIEQQFIAQTPKQFLECNPQLELPLWT